MIEKNGKLLCEQTRKKIDKLYIKHNQEQGKHGFAHPDCTGILSSYVTQPGTVATNFNILKLQTSRDNEINNKYGS